MVKSNNIQIFLRVRPTKKIARGLQIDEENKSINTHISQKREGEYVNNAIEDRSYKFDGILGMQVKQEQVFETIAQPVVDSVLDGYNGTVFAYGQTGSGKTFTITGGAERYVDRGLIPRTISYIFSEVRRRTDMVFKVSVSYLEIYNESGYDLLDESQNSRNLTDLPKVKPREDANERVVLNNLSVHRADSEEDALNLLFIGDTNRVVAETPTHDASTRSHCIFIVQLEVQKGGSDVKTVSRMHLVDLAGSERIGKTGVTGQLESEARYINLSLMYLEQVIVCLHKKSLGEQTHIPYRNSLMTMVLRDSLGGNCKTTMIATMHAEERYLDESVSTCNFAQRVACIKNSASRNEQVDPSLIIQRLKGEISELKAEIRILKGGNDPRENLEPEEIEECRRIVSEFIDSRDPSMKIVVGDMLKIHECFFQIKRMWNEGKGGAITTQVNGDPVNDPEEVARLKMLVKQRDNEIAILLGHINKNKGMVLTGAPSEESKSTDHSLASIQAPAPQQDFMAKQYELKQEALQASQRTPSKPAQREPDLQAPTDVAITAEQLADRNKAFDVFRKSYRRMEAMEENKSLLKEKITEAKSLTTVINGARKDIESIKNEIEALRRENAVQGLVDSENVPLEHPREKELTSVIETHKSTYRDGVGKLKELKVEIERIQRLLENGRKRMQTDFDAWLAVMMQQSNKSGSTSVDENLDAFYKARDQIYSNLPK